MPRERINNTGLAGTTISRDKDLMERFERITAGMTYPPTLAAMVRRGFVLALDELEHRTKTGRND